jgi:hypothetical protein
MKIIMSDASRSIVDRWSVTDNSRVMFQLVASFTIINYDLQIFIVQARALLTLATLGNATKIGRLYIV